MQERVAYFISPHGFGHAARAAAIMSAVHGLDPCIRFEIFTTVQRWFFEDSLSGPFGYHSCVSDIGLVQKTPLSEDLDETLSRLDHFLPFQGSTIETLARLIEKLRCKLIICDISPMGIAVAKKSGIPSVLVENFTWDWVYEAYERLHGGFGRHAAYLRNVFDSADYRVQTEPVCSPRDSDLITSPVSRKTRTLAEQIRSALGIPPEGKLAMVTMGGIPEPFALPERFAGQEGVWFVFPGGSRSREKRGNLIVLPHRSEFFHPDLINAADVVVGKLGYSTLAEVFHSGVPFGYITREDFRESEILADYAAKKMSGFPVEKSQFGEGRWLSCVKDLLALPRVKQSLPNGSSRAAGFIRSLLKESH